MLRTELTFTRELVAVLILVSGIGCYVFRLWTTDLSIPFNYWGDTLWFMTPIKGMLLNGWVYEIPQLSAPFELSAAAFPSMTNLDWLIMKGISLATTEPGLVINVYWLFSILLTACTACWALNSLGVSRWTNVACSVVYAFLPFVFLRNVAHISLVYFTVPMLAVCAIRIANERLIPGKAAFIWPMYAALVAQGLNYIYFSFFSVALFLFAGILGFSHSRSLGPLKRAAVASFVLVSVSLLNLVPSFLSWKEHGKPPDMGYKSPMEAEVYGLKIRKMLSPHSENVIPGLSQWARKDAAANFPNENENATARLGLLASSGFVLLMAVWLRLIRPRPQLQPDQVDALPVIGSLTLFALLVTTVGGLGAMFNLAIPDIRAYNRFSVFIAFFSLAGLAVWLRNLLESSAHGTRGRLYLAFFSVLAVLSLYDQLLDAKPLVARRAADAVAVKEERRLVHHIESLVDAQASVFQLPVTGFPPDGGRLRMLPYDHARPHLWSQRLSWSWPSFSQKHQAWLNQLTPLEGQSLVNAMVLSKFRFVWIDRYGYEDNGQRLIASLADAGGLEIAAGMSERYVVLDLTEAKNRLQSELGEAGFAAKSEALLSPPLKLQWTDGFYESERDQQGRTFRWSRATGALTIRYFGTVPWSGALSFIAGSGNAGDLTLTAGDQKFVIPVGRKPATVTVPVGFNASGEMLIRFSSTTGKVNAPRNETRELHFYVLDAKLNPDINP